MTRQDTRKIPTLRVRAQLLGALTVFVAMAALSQTGATASLLWQDHPINRAQRKALDASPSGSGPLFFMPVVDYSSGGFGPASVAVADVNGDSKPDLIVANPCTDGTCQGSSVGVLLGNGDGTFGTVATYASGGNKTYSVVVADVNRDGKPDLVLTNFCTGSNCLPPATVGVLLGKGDGTFQPAATYNSAEDSNALAVADVNRDGKADILVIGPDKVAVLRGNGDGTFQSAVKYSLGSEVGSSVAVADVNGDGKPDLLLGNT